MQNLKYGTSEPIYKIEIGSQTENRFVVPKEDEVGERLMGSLGLANANLVQRIDRHQGPTI